LAQEIADGAPAVHARVTALVGNLIERDVGSPEKLRQVLRELASATRGALDGPA
jgi:hypothetical protein